MNSVPLRKQHTSLSPACLRVLFTTRFQPLNHFFPSRAVGTRSAILLLLKWHHWAKCFFVFRFGKSSIAVSLNCKILPCLNMVTDLCYFLHLQIERLVNFPVQTGASNEARILHHVTRGMGIHRALGCVLCRNGVGWLSPACMPGKQPPWAAVSAPRAELV